MPLHTHGPAMLETYKNGDRQLQGGNGTIRFGAFEADLRSGEVRKSGSRIKLQEQPFKVLQILLEHPGDLVTREELQSRIWPKESFGDFDHAVNVAIGKLRTALGDSPDNPLFIETVPRRGYRFVGKLESAAVIAPPSLPEPKVADPAKTAPNPRILLLASVAILSVALLLAAAGIFAWRNASQSPAPEFQRLTVRNGTVFSARFAPDGQTVIYAAAWDGAPIEMFSRDPMFSGSRSLGLPGTHFLAVSPSGQMAVLQDTEYHFQLTIHGTLGQVPLTGGTPRQIAENIDWADWSMDGSQLAVVREVAGKQRLEYPLGHVLYETAGWISHIRISPQGDQIAFLDHTIYPDDRGNVAIVDLAGHKRVLSSGWETEEGLAWSPDGREVWFSAAKAGLERKIYAVNVTGRERLAFRAPGGMTLQDIAPDGSVLLTRDESRVGMRGLAAGETKERELSWMDWSLPAAISRDGKTVLFDEEGEGGGANYTVAMRDLLGSPPIPLGEGMAGDISPDGKWAASIVANSKLVLLPTGAGNAKQLERGDIEQYGMEAKWLPDGKQVIFSGNQAGHAVRCFIQNVDGGKPRPVTPEGVNFCQVSPDGKWIAGSDLVGGELVGGAKLFPLDGGASHPIPGLHPGEGFTWSADPRFLYTWELSPANVYRLNILTGQRQFVRAIAPPDVTGTCYLHHVLFSADGRAYVYGYSRLHSELYLVKGLK